MKTFEMSQTYKALQRARMGLDEAQRSDVAITDQRLHAELGRLLGSLEALMMDYADRLAHAIQEDELKRDNAKLQAEFDAAFQTSPDKPKPQGPLLCPACGSPPISHRLGCPEGGA